MGTMRNLSALITLGTLSVACATTAHAEDRTPAKPPQGSHAFEIEVADAGQDSPKRADKLELLAPEGATSQLSTRSARDAAYDVKLSWRGSELDLVVDRRDAPGTPGGFHVATRSTFVVGQRILLARIARAGGGATEVVAIVR